jgi:hypothetical protein
VKLLRTIRFDDSDTRVFPHAAEPGEWAVPGTFVFADSDPAQLDRRVRQAFANGFLGLSTFGWSTLVAVAAVSDADYEQAVDALADHLQEAYGAPDRQAARTAAREEIDYAVSLCEQPVNTLLSLSRFVEGDAIREQFRVVQPPGDKLHAKIWEIVPDDDGSA